MTTTVDMLPFEALEVAARSPRALERFLDSLDDDTLSLVGSVAEQVLLAVGRAEVHRAFSTMWQRVGQAVDAAPAWPETEAPGAAEGERRTELDAPAADLPAGAPEAVSTQVVPADVVAAAVDAGQEVAD